VKLQGKTRAEEEQQSPYSWQSGKGRDSWANAGVDKENPIILHLILRL
jgi:hypothetical protein